MRPSSPPLPVRLYSAAANLIAPLAYRRVVAKLTAQGVATTRLRERMGHATKTRPDGTLLWFHAASVGESLSVLRLIQHMGSANPEWSFLLTSGTATSAEIVAKRLPARCMHQFAPLDSRRAMRRFLSHWQPSAAIFVESELWPQMLGQTHAASIPLALLNARISDRSARNWKWFTKTAQHVLGHFDMIHTQDARTTQHLHDLGLSHATTGQNLKSVAGPLPYDEAEFKRLKKALKNRPTWVASSTHPGEDEVMLDAHQDLLRTHPDLLLILVPRHPQRRDDIELLIDKHGLTGIHRSDGGQISDKAQVYLADTLGETGLWYALSPITCLCGSFTPVGGHNPYEPAYAGSAVIHGPLYANFTQDYADLDASGGALQVEGAMQLMTALDMLIKSPEKLDQMRGDIRRFATRHEDILDDLSKTLSCALSLS